MTLRFHLSCVHGTDCKNKSIESPRNSYSLAPQEFTCIETQHWHMCPDRFDLVLHQFVHALESNMRKFRHSKLGNSNLITRCAPSGLHSTASCRMPARYSIFPCLLVGLKCGLTIGQPYTSPYLKGKAAGALLTSPFPWYTTEQPTFPSLPAPQTTKSHKTISTQHSTRSHAPRIPTSRRPPHPRRRVDIHLPNPFTPIPQNLLRNNIHHRPRCDYPV